MNTISRLIQHWVFDYGPPLLLLYLLCKIRDRFTKEESEKEGPSSFKNSTEDEAERPPPIDLGDFRP